ncbi:MAG: hypothetical protein QXF32_03650, partial [Candidatus Thermoplasmatota archaeon]
MKRKIYACFAILILISLPIFSVGGENKENDKITVKIYTREGIKEIKKELEREEVIKLQEMANEAKETFLKLFGNSKEKKEANEIINSFLYEMKKSGLLGEMSVKEVKELIFPKYQKNEIQKIKLLSNIFEQNKWEVNLMCRMEAQGVIADLFPWNFILACLFLYSHYPISIIAYGLWMLLDFIPHPTTMGYWEIYACHYGAYFPATVTTSGLLGTKTIE